MHVDATILAHAAILLLFVAAGLLVSLVAALIGAMPWWADLAPTAAAILVGHGVASRLAEAAR